MKQQFLVNNIKEITNTPEFVKNFLNQFKDCLEVKSRFGKCQEILGIDIASDIPSETVMVSMPRFHDSYTMIEVKIKSITPQEDNTFIIQFASEEDAKLYQDNYKVNPIRMIFV